MPAAGRGDEEDAGPAPILHGGDLAAARRLFPEAPEPWLDLSTGINPVPYPLPPFEASALTRLPSQADLAALKRAAAAAYGARDLDEIACAPGTQILIETLPRLMPATRVAVVGPTYAEHAAAWGRAGHAVETVPELAATAAAAVVVLVSPNNPDGRRVAPAEIEALRARLARAGGLLVLDRAFADLEPGEGAWPGERDGLVELRSFGKSYGLAGLRLGFALASPEYVARLETALGPWAVSGPAIAAGRIALSDLEWRRQMAQTCAAEADRLDRMLLRAGGRLVGGTTLFRTADFPDGPGLFRRLGAAGIYVRRFAEHPARLRFGLPGGKAAWCRLSRVLKPS
ncbi:threonine-phosphate decarboxylase CobD [Methylobacterium organophilum]|uniref:8-amino-7-oxononanoate synthase n=1 Tax=Methylobacterium organophilum TaxID=410 RepID=A0ABQ4T3V4_METOR|nr:threonine-phosphate decarboxylase CobD [Methylobacterium organophilum]GJE26283.1 Threonine-phosphate decarboxylase [Methylobacterium organophilum]